MSSHLCMRLQKIYIIIAFKTTSTFMEYNKCFICVYLIEAIEWNVKSHRIHIEKAHASIKTKTKRKNKNENKNEKKTWKHFSHNNMDGVGVL